MKDFGTLVEDEPKDFGTVVQDDFKDFGTVVEDDFKDFGTVVGDDPSLGQIGTGLVTEVAIGEGAKYAGATAGAAIGAGFGGVGAVPGAAIGYIGGGISGGISGSIAAQRLEGKEDISWGRVTADTILNLLPFGAGKVSKGAKLLPRLAGAAVKRGGQGAVLSTGAAAIEKGIEEGEMLTLDELMMSAGVGATLGVGLGVAGSALNKSYSKLLNKNTDEIDALYKKGDVDAVSVVDAITGGDPNGRVNRMLNGVYQYILPSKVIGNRASEDVRRAVNEMGTARELAGRARENLDGVYTKLTKPEQQLVDKFIAGESTALPPNALPMQGVIEESRQIIDEFSSKILKLSDQGILDFGKEGGALIETIKKNLGKDGSNYLTREYRFYEDANYVPSPEARKNLTDSLASALRRDGSQNAEEEARDLVRKLDDSRNPDDMAQGASRGMNILAENNRLFKQRKVLDKTMRDFLGEYKTPGERVYGTISRLGTLVAQQEAALKVSDNLQKSGLAIRASQIPEGMEQAYQPLKVNRQRVERSLGDSAAPKEQLYVLKEVNQSVKQLFATGVPQDTNLMVENIFTKILSSTTGMTKFVKVPLAPAAYSPQFVGNMFMILGQGMNPFRGAGKGMRVAANEIFGKGLTLKELQRYKSLGLVDKEILSSDIRNAFNKGYKLMPDGRLGKSGGFALKKLGKIYSAIDTANRITVFANYQKQLKSLIPGIDDVNSKNFMDGATKDKLAAELTNSTYQNYDRISPSLRYLSRVGVLNEFVSFNLELTRTTFNQAKLAKSMVDGSFAKRMKDEYGVTVSQGYAAYEGGKRIVALSGALGAATVGIAAFNKAEGFDDEKVRAIKETAAPSWDKSSALLIQDQGDGKVGLINMAYRMPAAELTSIFEAGLGTGSYTDASSEMFQSFTDKFFGAGTMNAKNIVNTLQNYNPKTGRTISDKVNRLDRVIDQATFYGKEGFTPGFVKDIKRWDESTSGDLGARYLTGERKMNTTFTKGAKFKFRALDKNIRGIRSGYTGAVKYDGNPASSYNEYNESYRQNAAEMVKHVKNLRILGVNEKEIFDTLPDNFSKSLKEMVMAERVPDMRIATAVKGTSLERVKSYADQYKNLSKDSEELARKMLEQEAVLGRISGQMLKNIMAVVRFQSAL
tara:strand:+ start:7471 stop:10917 length:3447 start_codon:yes stop_codon:yes gene_type:complete